MYARVERAPSLRGIYLYTPYNPAFVAAIKQFIPADLRLWESEGKRWYVFESHAEIAIKLARKFWPGIDTSDHAGKQHQQHERQRASAWARPARSDCGALYVTDDAPAEVIKAAYKALAIKHHPDHGGDVAAMQAVNAAYDRLKKAGKV